MERGDIYRIEKPTRIEPKKFRAFVVVSRRRFILSSYQTVICAPIYTNRNGVETEVNVGIDKGLKHDSAIRCDALLSLEKSKLTNFIGSLSSQKIKELNHALKIALGLDI
jgi:mRNA interferase MazF